jgi:hypothetical protein
MPNITIEELEKMLASDEELTIELQPDGSIKSVNKDKAIKRVIEIKSIDIVNTYY